jgi:sigma-B regulation protein RsbU (phosphoserine phosphatase)
VTEEQRDIARLRRRIAQLDAEALVREGRIAELIADAVEREVDMHELEAMRDVLAPSELRAGPGLEVECLFAAAADGVAGDFYLVAPGPDEESTILAVGDVAGKRIDTALRATFVRTSLATFAGFVDDPCRLLELSNQVLVERTGTSSVFVTAVAVVVHPRDGRVAWASAGHPPPLRLDTGELLNGHPPAPPLGVDAAITCRAGEDVVAPGAGVLLFTDGLTEAHRPRHELFGERRLVETLRELAGSAPHAVVRRLESDVLAHAGESLGDDLCIVAARVAAT